jgi:biotin transporter BioY
MKGAGAAPFIVPDAFKAAAAVAVAGAVRRTRSR